MPLPVAYDSPAIRSTACHCCRVYWCWCAATNLFRGAHICNNNSGNGLYAIFVLLNTPMIYYQNTEDRRYNQRWYAKYLFPYIIAFLSLALIGQVIIQFWTVDNLNKVQGKIVNMQTRITGWRHQKFGKDTPDYSLVITLDNSHSYYITATTARENIVAVLRRGDSITIYYPTQLFKILSTGLYHQVTQVEYKGMILWSLDEQKQLNWVIMFFMAVLITLCSAGIRSWKK